MFTTFGGAIPLIAAASPTTLLEADGPPIPGGPFGPCGP